MCKQVKINIPELKPFTLVLSYNSYDKPNLGCHVRGISDLSLMYDGIKIPSLEWLEPSKYTSGYSAAAYANEWLKIKGLPPEQVEEIFAGLAKDWDLKPYPDYVPGGGCFVLLSDAVNEGSSMRNYGSIYRPNGLKIANFVQYLIKNNIGIVMGTPIGRNSLHNTETDTSLVQLWIWIPPGHVPFMMPGSAFMYGAEDLPDWQEWWETTSKSMNNIPKDQIQKRLFNDSLFTRHALEA